MISSAATSQSMMPSYFAPAEASRTAAPDTILEPSQTVQENSSTSSSQDTGGNAEKPIISLSVELVTALQGNQEAPAEESTEPTAEQKPPVEAPPPKTSDNNEASANEADEAKIDALKDRDTEVRAHEQAHAAAGGQYASSPSYEYETGPDNQQYAVGGEVQIDTAPVSGDPAATIAKMNIVRSAALAPSEPSGQDRTVAATAAKRISEAQAELASQSSSDTTSTEETSDTAAPSGESGYPPSSTGPETPNDTSNIINIIS